MNDRYSILIQWSNEDQIYLASLPEFGPYARTHGNSYEDALKNAREVLELLIEDYRARNKPLPSPSNLKITVEI
ncbi:MAG: type II toxin-antitoxin system HicB family antitoxin [Prochloraceae cyanobacterium]